MTKDKHAARLIALLPAVVIIVGLCSCRAKEAVETAAKPEPATAYAAAAEPTRPEITTQPETATQPELTTRLEKTTRQVPTTKAERTQNRTPKEQTAGSVEIAGVETVKDGSKTIVYPTALRTASTRWPVIAWANGTGCPTQTYTALLKALAGGGYIVIADDSVMSGDGTAQIDSLDYILRQSRDPSGAFYHKVDTGNLGVCGHSQGGRSCINAAQTDDRIRCVVSIAGASSVEEAGGLCTPCLFLTGTCDFIVASSYWCRPSYDAVAGRAAYASLRGGVHTTCMIRPEKVSGYIVDWFDAYLKNDTAAQAVFADGGKLANDRAWTDFQNKN